MQETKSKEPAWWLPLAAVAILGSLALWSAVNILQHMGDGGCDGGTCTVMLLFVPAYLLGYSLLWPAFLWLSRRRPTWLGAVSLVSALLGLGLGYGLRGISGATDYARASSAMYPPAVALTASAWVTLAALAAGVAYQASRRATQPLKPVAD